MKLLFDFFPIILFFVVYKISDIYTATAAAIAATVLMIAAAAIKYRKVEPMQWLSLGIIVVFGGATLLAHDENFIKWKPTVLYAVMALLLAGSQLLFRKNLIESLMAKQVDMPTSAWNALNWSWVAFFVLMGVLNIWVAYQFSTDTWVSFKLFGGIGLMLAFVVGQAFYIQKRSIERPS